MDLIYSWVGNILFFLILMSLVEVLLPSKKYGTYIRFFAGMVLILLVLQPFLGVTGLDDRIAGYFETIRFQAETRDLSREILGIERQRLDRAVSVYEAEAAKNVEAMAWDAGFEPVSARVTIVGDTEDETYGQVSRVELVVREAGQEAEKEVGKEADGPEEDEVRPAAVEPVQIEVSPIKLETEETGASWDEKSSPERSQVERSQIEQSQAEQLQMEQLQIEHLRRKVERYYELEPENLEIRLEKG